MRKTKMKVKKTNGKTYTTYKCNLCGGEWDYREDAEQCYSNCSRWATMQLKKEFGIQL